MSNELQIKERLDVKLYDSDKDNVKKSLLAYLAKND